MNKDAEKFFAEHYVPGNITMAVVGFAVLFTGIVAPQAEFR